MKRSKWIKGEKKPRPTDATDDWNKPSEGKLIDKQEFAEAIEVRNEMLHNAQQFPDAMNERRRRQQELMRQAQDRLRLNQTLNARTERERHINSISSDFDFLD